MVSPGHGKKFCAYPDEKTRWMCGAREDRTWLSRGGGGKRGLPFDGHEDGGQKVGQEGRD